MVNTILSLLPRGENNAISSRELAIKAGYKSVRELQHTIEALRRKGAIIASTCRHGGGYFYPHDTGELRAFVKTCINRASNTYRSVSGARKLLKLIETSNPDQLSLFSDMDNPGQD